MVGEKKIEPSLEQKTQKDHQGDNHKDRNRGKSRKFWQVVFSNWRGKLLSLIIAIAIYIYYQSAIQVKVSFTLPLHTVGVQNRIVNLLDVREVTLNLSGRAKDLENLRSSDFEAYVRLNPNDDGIQNLQVHYQLRNNNLRLGKGVDVLIEPNVISLAVEHEEDKELPIEVSIQGYPATGYSLGTYRVYPHTVIITGPASVLQNLEAISTKPIDITGKSQPFQELVDLKLPLLLGVEKNIRASLHLAFERVQVEIQINARSETQTFSLTPHVVNLPENLMLRNMFPMVVQLTLQGSSDLLQEIKDGIRVITIELDAGDIFSSGRYALPIVVNDLPVGVSLLGSTPNRVSVVISEY